MYNCNNIITIQIVKQFFAKFLNNYKMIRKLSQLAKFFYYFKQKLCSMC